MGDLLPTCKHSLKDLKQGYITVHQYEILVNLKNFRFWDQICPKLLYSGVLGQTQPENNLF